MPIPPFPDGQPERERELEWSNVPPPDTVWECDASEEPLKKDRCISGRSVAVAIHVILIPTSQMDHIARSEVT